MTYLGCATGQDHVCKMSLSLNAVLQLTKVPRVAQSYSFSFVLGCHQLMHYRVELLRLACGSLNHLICLSLPGGGGSQQNTLGAARHRRASARAFCVPPRAGSEPGPR